MPPSNSPHRLHPIQKQLGKPSIERAFIFLGQPRHQPEVDDGAQTPCSGVFKVVRASSEPDIREPQSPSAARIHGRPRDSGPDGASDTGPVKGKERDFTPILGQRLAVTAKDNFDCNPPTGKLFTPEKDIGHSSSQNTAGCTSSKDKPREIKAYHTSNPVLKSKRAVATNSELKENAAVVSAETEKQRNYVMHAPTERALKNKPLALYKRSGPSPAFSVKSCDSDQYTELPTVIHVSRRQLNSSKDSDSSTPTRTPRDTNATSSATNATVSDMRSRPSTENRLTKLVSRDKRVTSSPSLPSKPRVDVRTKRAQKS